MDISKIKLGALKPIPDKRDIKLSLILKALPPIPDSWDWDTQLDMAIPTPMFANDRYGCCVISARAHQTLRLEAFEQKQILPISDNDVTTEYFKESNGTDSGLYGLNSLKAWRNGWNVTTATKTRKSWCRTITVTEQKPYNIYAFALVNQLNQAEVKAAIYLLMGGQLGLALPITARSQIGKLWDIVDDSPPGSWGYHEVYLKAYDADILECITWGAKQKMTWAWFMKYCSDLRVVVDNKDIWLENSPVDYKLLESYLIQVGKEDA